jgi:hypothetical protein
MKQNKSQQKKNSQFFPKDQTFMTKTPKKKKNRAPLFIPSSPQQLEQRPHRLQDQKKQQQQQQEQHHQQHQYS